MEYIDLKIMEDNHLFPIWNPALWNPLWMVKFAGFFILTCSGPHIESTLLFPRSLWINRKAAFKPRAFDHSVWRIKCITLPNSTMASHNRLMIENYSRYTKELY